MIVNLNSNISDIRYSGYTISKTYACGGSLVYEKEEPTPTPYSGQYLSFTALEDGTFNFNGNSVNYSLDNGATWTTLSSNTNTPTIAAGSKILWKGNLTPVEGVGRFSSTGRFNVEGNIMSLLYGDDFEGKTSLEGKNTAFYGLFSSCTNLISAENLSLPATTLVKHCYLRMFEYCRSLTKAPQLPATTLADSCYYYMFGGCISLTTAPELPATTLANTCYYGMFNDCTSLNYIKCLATYTSGGNSTLYWIRNVASSGTFVKAKGVNWPSGENGIPNGWAVQNA